MEQQPRKRVAAVVTAYDAPPRSHADSIVTKLLEGYELFWTPLPPRLDVVSLYTDQVSPRDISRDLAARHGFAIYPTIREALTLGGDTLAVDGVVIVGEHGDYPFNEKGQHLYPRRRFFEETVAVFRASGRVVPVFNDKHLAYNWADARWMYDTARELGIPFMAGSSMPVAFRCPPAQVPLGAEIEEIVAVGHGPLESYGYHILEVAQCLAERRKGFETGVASVQCLKGDVFWDAWERGGRWSRDLQEAALAVVTHAEGSPREFYARRRAAGERPADRPGGGISGPPRYQGEEIAFLIEYRDGLRLTVLMLGGYVQQRGVAVRLRGEAAPLATCFIQSRERSSSNFCHLVFLIEELILTGRPPYPVERTLLTTGLIDAVMISHHEGGRRIDTPYLSIAYAPPGASEPAASAG